MNIEITARNFTPSQELKTFIKDRLIKLLKYDSNISFSKVVLNKESRAEKVELIITSNKNQYITKCYSSVFEKTVAKAIDNIKIQIRKKN
mgnify:FL=1|tara:strand:+ start:511 stop:780 length:270 start_codon:yes stop_codon:yes gene_type:complete